MNIISPPKDLLKDLADSYETWYEYHASRCHIGVVTLNFLLSQYHIFHNITSEFRMVIIRIIFIIWEWFPQNFKQSYDLPQYKISYVYLRFIHYRDQTER